MVRCSSCGAARLEGTTRCPYCESEFTLHERDLNTVCPHCLALVSDRARFCHHCGTGLVPELDAGTESELLCPGCQDGRRLVSRRLGEENVAALECGTCAGLWIGHDAFHLLLERARHDVLPDGTFLDPPRELAAGVGLPPGAASARGPRHRSFYRPCPVCGEAMNRRNYGHSSGVIIDLCKGHGVWFDADELARILAWVRAGGDRKSAAESPEVEAAMRAHYAAQRPRSFFASLLHFLFGSKD